MGGPALTEKQPMADPSNQQSKRVVLDDDTDRDGTADSLRDIALDVIIEYSPAVELHILSETTFERHQRSRTRSLARRSEGRSYA